MDVRSQLSRRRLGSNHPYLGKRLLPDTRIVRTGEGNRTHVPKFGKLPPGLPIIVSHYRDHSRAYIRHHDAALRSGNIHDYDLDALVFTPSASFVPCAACRVANTSRSLWDGITPMLSSS